jgi:hypothetical protein
LYKLQNKMALVPELDHNFFIIVPVLLMSFQRPSTNLSGQRYSPG